MRNIIRIFYLSVIVMAYSVSGTSAKEVLGSSQYQLFDPVSFSNQIRSFLDYYRPSSERKWAITIKSDPTFVKNGSKFVYTIPGLVFDLSALKSRIALGDITFSVLPDKNNNLDLSLSVRDHLDLVNYLDAKLGEISFGSNAINFIWNNALNTISSVNIELSNTKLKMGDAELVKIGQASYAGEIKSNLSKLWESNINFKVSELSAIGVSVDQIKGNGSEKIVELPLFISALHKIGQKGSAGSWFLGGTRVFPSLWDKILSPDQIIALLKSILEIESKFVGSNSNYEIIKIKVDGMGSIDGIKVSGGFNRSKSDFFNGNAKLALDKIQVIKPEIKKSILKLLPTDAELDYSLTNIPSELLIPHFADLIVQLYDINKQNLSKAGKRKSLAKIWGKYGPIFVRGLEDAGAEFKINELAFSSVNYDFTANAVANASSDAAYGVIAEISLRVDDINKFIVLINNSEISKNRKWQNLLDILKLNHPAAAGWKSDGGVGKLIVKLGRDGHLSVNNEDLGPIVQIISTFSNAPTSAPKYKNEDLPSEVSKEERLAKAKILYSRGFIDKETYENLKKLIGEDK